MVDEVDIAALNASEKLEFAQAVGSVKLVGATLLVDTPYIDFTLPATYVNFALKMGNIFITNDIEGNNFPENAGAVTFLFSQDGGSTFLDEYHFTTLAGFGLDAGLTTTVFDDDVVGYGPDGVMINSRDDPYPTELEMTIDPGSASLKAGLWGRSVTNEMSTPSHGREIQLHDIRSMASTARANVLRVATAGYPSEGQFQAGTWYQLFGIAL